VRVAHTRLGTVAYRVMGTGPPLILITGYTATMEDWDPRFVGALTEHYRVVIFDNAGVGRTQPLRYRGGQPLTLPRPRPGRLASQRACRPRSWRLPPAFRAKPAR